MNEVYVVRQFFEDGNETDYIGVYTDFWAAVAASEAHQKENWGDDSSYGFMIHPANEFEAGMLWCEVTWHGEWHGIYYTINRMELS